MKGNKHINMGGAAAGRLWLLLMPAMLTLFGSCDRMIYDYEGDCSAHYLVQFRYDYNMKYADAFAHEVERVTLYLIDQEGNIVLEQSDSGEALGVEGYAMEVEVEPGTYSLMAWCGGGDNGSFTVPQTDVATGLTCTLGCEDDGDGPYVRGEVDRLYYGWLADQEFEATEGTHVFTVPLVKDTNTVRVVLQHVSGSTEVDPDKFTFTITSDNWAMDWDNSLISDVDATYYAFYTDRAEADIETSSTKAETKSTYSGAIAEFTISRMVPGRGDRLTIYNNETGEVTLSIPLSEFAVLVKGYYNQSMSDAEFLDRQDEYNFIFFLEGDNGDRWMNAYIYVNSWKVVLQTASL